MSDRCGLLTPSNARFQDFLTHTPEDRFVA